MAPSWEATISALFLESPSNIAICDLIFEPELVFEATIVVPSLIALASVKAQVFSCVFNRKGVA